MKIIKHGTPQPEPHFLFKCSECGCIFEMTQIELIQEQQSLVYIAQHNYSDCGKMIEGMQFYE